MVGFLGTLPGSLAPPLWCGTVNLNPFQEWPIPPTLPPDATPEHYHMVLPWIGEMKSVSGAQLGCAIPGNGTTVVLWSGPHVMYHVM
jgi:hypothetical protein